MNEREGNPESNDLLSLLAELVRKRTGERCLTRREDLAAEPLSLDDAGAAALIERMEGMEDAGELADIRVIRGSRQSYLYSADGMSGSYARHLARIEDRDIPMLIAETVREDSRIYPRPTEEAFFLRPPFSLDGADLKRALEELGSREGFEDIRTCSASNGASYLYSSRHLADDHARSLAEWIEVEQDQNP